MKLLKTLLVDGLGIGGIGLISYGAWLTAPALGFVVLGVGLIAMAYLAAKGN